MGDEMPKYEQTFTTDLFGAGKKKPMQAVLTGDADGGLTFKSKEKSLAFSIPSYQLRNDAQMKEPLTEHYQKIWQDLKLPIVDHELHKPLDEEFRTFLWNSMWAQKEALNKVRAPLVDKIKSLNWEFLSPTSTKQHFDSYLENVAMSALATAYKDTKLTTADFVYTVLETLKEKTGYTNGLKTFNPKQFKEGAKFSEMAEYLKLHVAAAGMMLGRKPAVVPALALSRRNSASSGSTDSVVSTEPSVTPKSKQ